MDQEHEHEQEHEQQHDTPAARRERLVEAARAGLPVCVESMFRGEHSLRIGNVCAVTPTHVVLAGADSFRSVWELASITRVTVLPAQQSGGAQ